MVIYKDKEFNSVDSVNTSSENLDSNLPRSYEDLNVSVIKSGQYHEVSVLYFALEAFVIDFNFGFIFIVSSFGNLS